MYRAMLIGALAAVVGLAAPALGSSRGQEFRAVLSGFNETGSLNAETGAILSEGSGVVEVKLDPNSQTLSFTLKFQNLSSPVTQAHIHFGKDHVPGGVMVFFCSNLATAPAGVQPCPASGGTVTGTVSAASFLAVAGQNVPAGNFDAVADALLSDSAYANVHTTNFPAGEIRGQLVREF